MANHLTEIIGAILLIISLALDYYSLSLSCSFALCKGRVCLSAVGCRMAVQEALGQDTQLGQQAGCTAVSWESHTRVSFFSW